MCGWVCVGGGSVMRVCVCVCVGGRGGNEGVCIWGGVGVEVSNVTDNAKQNQWRETFQTQKLHAYYFDTTCTYTS